MTVAQLHRLIGEKRTWEKLRDTPGIRASARQRAVEEIARIDGVISMCAFSANVYVGAFVRRSLRGVFRG